jgi:transaldolase
LFHGDRWNDLAARGATPQRCLWASTSVKNPSLRDTLYVEELIGPETISTMPEETIRAFQDHGRVARRLESDLDETHYLFNKLYAAGVDYDNVVATLERRASRRSSPRSTGCSTTSARSATSSPRPPSRLLGSR